MCVTNYESVKIRYKIPLSTAGFFVLHQSKRRLWKNE